MRMFRGYLIAACALALASCAGFGGNVPPDNTNGNAALSTPDIGNPVSNATVLDEKAMYAAEALYNVPAHAYVSADSRGQLTAATKAKVKPILTKLYDALKLARTAYNVGNASDFNAAFSELTKLSEDAKALLPAAK